jgi:hypothetical protein
MQHEKGCSSVSPVSASQIANLRGKKNKRVCEFERHRDFTIEVPETKPRLRRLTFAVVAINALNNVNLGTPNGVLLSPLFNKSQSLAGNQFGSPVSGNRYISLQSTFSF